MLNNSFSSYGVSAVIADLLRRYSPTPATMSFDDAERRLQETMKPARLAPVDSMREQAENAFADED
jgi:hypothetical protein